MIYILTDVEGTTTSISFVHNTLFPFAKERLKSFIARKSGDDEVQNILAQTKKTALEENQKNLNDNEASDLLIHWIDTDRKHPALKNLQGLIWEEGYNSGEIKGHVYKDVPSALENWKKQGLILGVYSSGSVQAQKLIFGFSTEGNLQPFFTNNFDTAVGNKREVSSYANIVEQLKIPAKEILFLSDIKEELDAARTAGMQTIQLVRQNDVVIGDHKTAKDFTEIKF
ncbi:MAG: acireductone synthase [Rhizobacter sp.]|nr:acireductone synthase [Bacteriovorax sp.]